MKQKRTPQATNDTLTRPRKPSKRKLASDTSAETKASPEAETATKKSQSQLKSELRKLRRESFQYKSEVIGWVEKLSMEKPDVLARLICEAVLAEGDLEQNPFHIFAQRMDAKAKKEGYGRSSEHYAPHARLILDAMAVKDDRQAIKTEYISLRDWTLREGSIAHSLRMYQLGRRYIQQFHRAETNDSMFMYPDEPEFIQEFFEQQQSNICIAFFIGCEATYHGLPLYRTADGSAFERLSYSDEDYVYLSKIGQHGGVPEDWRLPYWATMYWYRTDHLKEHRRFFAHAETPSHEDVMTLRRAMRAHLAASDPSLTEIVASPNSYSPALGTALKIANRDVPELFSNRRFGWPSKAEIMEYVKKNVPSFDSDKRSEGLAVVATPPEFLKEWDKGKK